jgi:HAMP domain-containing protein
MPADPATEDKPKPFLGLSGTQTIGSALAAVTSALVGSFLGVAGTLIGAALGSVVATVGAALYARTLSSATTMALTKIPQRRKHSLHPDNGEVLAASAPAESDEPQAAPISKRLSPTTWIKVGAVSAAAFVLAMVGVTAVEFGTNRPISSLVSSTSSIDNGAIEHTTTLGKALGGNTTAPAETDEPAEDVGQGQVEEGAYEEGGLTTNVNPSGGDSGTTGGEEPGANELGDTAPTDLAPETEPTLEPVPEVVETPEPEVSFEPAP